VQPPVGVPSGGVPDGDDPSRRVCACRLVTEGTIVASIRDGADSLREIIRRTDAATSCLACLPTVWQLLARERARAGDG
jgi:nitrite reductase (NAD(P)H)